MKKERPPPFLIVSIFATNAAIIYIINGYKNTTHKKRYNNKYMRIKYNNNE